LEIVMHLSLALCVLIPTAPVPQPKAPHSAIRADVVGCWRMNWAGSTWFAEFTDDGQYSCWDERSGWVGYWQVDNGVLTVRERPAQCHSLRYSGHAWSVRLTRTPHRDLDGAAQTANSGVLLHLSRMPLASR